MTRLHPRSTLFPYTTLFRSNFGKRSFAVRRLPDQRRRFVETEKRRIYSRHDHHFAAKLARSYRGTAGDINVTHPISSQARASGVKISRETSTRETKLTTESNT